MSMMLANYPGEQSGVKDNAAVLVPPSAFESDQCKIPILNFQAYFITKVTKPAIS